MSYGRITKNTSEVVQDDFNQTDFNRTEKSDLGPMSFNGRHYYQDSKLGFSLLVRATHGEDSPAREFKNQKELSSDIEVSFSQHSKRCTTSSKSDLECPIAFEEIALGLELQIR